MVINNAIQLPTQVWQHIVQLGVERHIQELEDQLLKAQQRIAEFEHQYEMSFASLQKVVVSPLGVGVPFCHRERRDHRGSRISLGVLGVLCGKKLGVIRTNTLRGDHPKSRFASRCRPESTRSLCGVEQLGRVSN